MKRTINFYDYIEFLKSVAKKGNYIESEGKRQFVPSKEFVMYEDLLLKSASSDLIDNYVKQGINGTDTLKSFKNFYQKLLDENENKSLLTENNIVKVTSFLLNPNVDLLDINDLSYEMKDPELSCILATIFDKKSKSIFKSHEHIVLDKCDEMGLLYKDSILSDRYEKIVEYFMKLSNSDFYKFENAVINMKSANLSLFVAKDNRADIKAHQDIVLKNGTLFDYIYLIQIPKVDATTIEMEFINKYRTASHRYNLTGGMFGGYYVDLIKTMKKCGLTINESLHSKKILSKQDASFSLEFITCSNVDLDKHVEVILENGNEHNISQLEGLAKSSSELKQILELKRDPIYGLNLSKDSVEFEL